MHISMKFFIDYFCCVCKICNLNLTSFGYSAELLEIFISNVLRCLQSESSKPSLLFGTKWVLGPTSWFTVKTMNNVTRSESLEKWIEIFFTLNFVQQWLLIVNVPFLENLYSVNIINIKIISVPFDLPLHFWTILNWKSKRSMDSQKLNIIIYQLLQWIMLDKSKTFGYNM